MRRLTIGQVAVFAGVTIKTVRHYHRLGLIAEPKRDSAGYRRYDSADLLRLVRVRTLAAAGVPLAEIGALLDAAPEQFAAALSDIQRRLSAQIDALNARRDTLVRLAEGDRVLLPARACALLDRLGELGFDRGYVGSQREGLVLFRALLPEGFEHFLAVLEQRLADPEFVGLMKCIWALRACDATDPRIPELASALSDNLLAHRELLVPPPGFEAKPDAPTRYGLVNHHQEDQLPAIARLTELLDAHLRAAGIDVPR
ncbi:MAG: MerR family transcriptional regulator [Polyangiales bacterium]